MLLEISPGSDLMPRLILALMVLSVVILSGMGSIRPASAVVQTFTVTKTADTNDGTCNADCSLREAITAANNNANHIFGDRDVINFNIPGAGVKLLQPTSALPVITGSVEIRGLSQPLAACNSHFRTILIQLDGNSAPAGADGLVFDYTIGGGSIVEGLSVTNWGGAGILFEDGQGHSAICNNIGLSPAGASDGNGLGLEVVDADSVTIGGTSGAAARNVISGNGSGVFLHGTGTAALIQGNYIGTNAAGTAALANTVGISSPLHFGLTVGGTSAGARNVISGSIASGISIAGNGTATIQGNYIGYAANGTSPIPNGFESVIVKNIGPGNSVAIGGIGAGQGNRIYADTGKSGILVEAVTGQTVERVNIRGNRISAGLLGINLQPVGESPDTITGNDALDLDSGPNGLQNFPVLTSAAAGAPGTISGTMPGKFSSTYQLDFYSGSACSGTHRDGQVYLGSATVSTTIGSPTASFAASISGFTEGDRITATATDSAGNTSEFSGCVTATGQVPETLVVNSINDADDGTCNVTHCSLREAVNRANTNGNPEVRDNITFGIGGSGIKTIALASDLTVTQAVSIDGTTQPGATCTDVSRNLLIRIIPLGGQMISFEDVASPGVLLRGLSVGGFSDIALAFLGGADHRIECNHIGVEPSGNVALPNDRGLLLFDSPGTVIGGTSASKRNIFGGHTSAALPVSGSATIQGNYFGLGLDGTTLLPNVTGISASDSADLLIGGTTPEAANVFGEHLALAILVAPVIQNANVLIQGNIIGYRPDGTTELTGNISGIRLMTMNDGSLNGGLGFGATVGGTGAGEANRIHTTGVQPGVSIVGITSEVASRHAIRGNAISSPGSLGIDISRNGLDASGDVLANDDLDPDTGPNGLQNYPVLTSASGGTPGSVLGTLNSTANATFTIDFYRGTGTCGQAGTRDGEVYLGSAVVNTNGSGDAAFNTPIAAGFSNGALITATATDANGNTSEFSDCVTATAPPATEFVVNTTDNTNDGTCNVAHCSLREAITAANGNGNSTLQDVISFAIPGGGIKVISVPTALPSITQSVLIDGSTQPGATCAVPGRTILIELRGIGLPGDYPGLRTLHSDGPGTTIKGLSITDFGIDGVVFLDGVAHGLECSNIGIEADGQTARGNADNGVVIIGGQNNRVGNDTESARNIIGGNANAGIAVDQTGTGTFIAFNFIGLAADGSSERPNGVGIRMLGVSLAVVISNVISGNTGSGVEFAGKVTFAQIRSNYIGYGADGTTTRPNGSRGIEIVSATTISNGNSIGGKLLGQPNRIYAEFFPAIEVRTGAGDAFNNHLALNEIKTLESLGIALTVDAEPSNEVTENDDLDADQGPNQLQNFPLLTLADPVQSEVTGTFNSSPLSELTLFFYAGGACGPERDGERILGSMTVGTDALGNAAFVANGLAAFSAGEGITATAVDLSGNTSEFSDCILAADTGSKSVTSSSPEELVAGSADSSVAVFGSGFEPGDVVTWNGTLVPTTFISDTELEFTATTDLLTFAMNTVDIGVDGASGVIEFQVTRSSSDINCDGTADAVDALFGLQVLAGLATESAQCPADANQSGGVIDIVDILHIRGETSGLIAPLKSLFQLPP
jgi:CSLREA domain-containing protein